MSLLYRSLALSSILILLITLPPRVTAEGGAESDRVPDLLAGCTLTEDNKPQREAVRAAEELIPAKYLRRFVAAGWTLDLSDTPYTWEGGTIGPDQYAAVTVPTEKTIYIYHLARYTNVCHEFGHFIAADLGLQDYIQSLYNQESGDTSRSMLGDYSQTNAGEFFAEVFEAYLTKPDLRQRMQAAMPLTYELIEQGLVGADTLIDADFARAHGIQWNPAPLDEEAS